MKTAKWNIIEKGYQYNYVSRRLKKREHRKKWNGMINQSVKPFNIVLNKKMLASLRVGFHL